MLSKSTYAQMLVLFYKHTKVPGFSDCLQIDYRNKFIEVSNYSQKSLNLFFLDHVLFHNEIYAIL